ncbi:MAG: hypothetical protein R3A45_03030 [Bdellovibrionota bacterium]
MGENGGTDSFTVVLNTAPASDVVIDVSSSDTGAATVSSSSLTFTMQTEHPCRRDYRDRSQRCDLVDESVTITICRSMMALSDDDFDDSADQTVTALVTDDDSAGFTVTESGGQHV